MKKMIFWMMVVGVILGFSITAQCVDIYISCSQESGNQIYLTSPHIPANLVPEGCLVQVISSDTSAVMEPDGNGIPQLPNRLVVYPVKLAKYIGTTPESTYGDGEYVTDPNWVPNFGNYKWVFLRVWNAHTVQAADKYGDSIPAQVQPGAGFNYTPASFDLNTSKPGPAGPTGFIGTGESGTSIRWSWTPYPGGANGYNLYNAVTDALISTTTEATIVESGLADYNTSAKRYVKALLPGETKKSNTYEAFTLANTPVVVTAKCAPAGSGKYNATVTWEASGNLSNTDYRLVKIGSAETLIALTKLRVATDESLSYGRFTYHVKAINGDQIPTAFSDLITCETQPGKPTLSATGITTNEITWNWTTPSGTDVFNFYLGAVLLDAGTTETARTISGLSACRAYDGKVEAVNLINGTGEAAILTKFTLPVVPENLRASPSAQGRSVDLAWDPDAGNFLANYEVQYSITSLDGYVTAEPPPTDQAYTVLCPQSSSYYWFRIRAKNGDGKYSGYTAPIWFESSAGDTGGTAPTISQVKFNGRSYTPGAVISSRPHITAVVTGEVDTTFTSGAVFIDEGQTTQIIIPGTDVTYETNVPDLPPGAKQLNVRVSEAIPAMPVSSHTLKIHAKNLTGAPTVWEGIVGVMSGKAQMIGNAYNFPNPFRPLSNDPNQNKTKISYNLSVDANITLIIYDITGHEVHRATYYNGSTGGQAGVNTVEWNGQSLFGETLGNGMYLYKVISGNSVLGSGKLVILD